MTVTAADTIRWLHDEGLVRLAGVADRTAHPVVAYTIDIADGTVNAHPASGSGLGSDVTTMAADDLPLPTGTRRRLVIVGVTTSDAMLIIDLAAVQTLSLEGEHPQAVARSWILQLLLNPEITLTTNNSAIAIDATNRCRVAFIPGAATPRFTVDDQRPPPTTIALGTADDPPNRLDIAADGSGAMYLGARYWALRAIHQVHEDSWAALIADFAREVLDDGSEQPLPQAD